MSGYVYLLGSKKFHWYKIGKTRHATIRVSELGILLPFRIEVIAIWQAWDHHELERLLHLEFEPYRVNGEWFSLSSQQVDRLVSQMRHGATAHAIGFTNIKEETVDPEGNVIEIKFRKHLTPEEREAKKQKSMAEHAEKKRTAKRCTSCGQTLRENKSLAANTGNGV